MGELIFGFFKKNWIGAGLALIKTVDWAGVTAKVFNYLLSRAIARSDYATVRLLAKRVLQQACYVLDVTDDGVVSAEESAQVTDAAKKLLAAWAAGAGKEITAPLEQIINGSVK